MPITQRNLPILHRKEWQMLSPLPATPANGALIIADPMGQADAALFVLSGTNQWLYTHTQDGYSQIPSGALSGNFTSGSCGIYYPWSITYSANGGSTSTVSVLASTHNISGLAIGSTIEFLSGGGNIGLRRTITDVVNNAGAGNVILVLDSAVPTAVLNTHTFRLSSGRFYVISAGAVAAGNWKVLDVATLAWQANLATTNLPASWSADGKLACAYGLGVSYATGTATGASSTTLTNSAKTWTTNQWTNYQVRITAGTGIGQVRTIASNTGTALTVGTAWATTPDTTSIYAIEGNEDFLYLLGNSAVTMYRYSISANGWTVMAPTTSRAAAPAAGMSADVIIKTGNVLWADEANIQDGRYIYSIRAGGGGAIDRFDIAGGTAGAGAWSSVNYQGAETFTSGSHATAFGEQIYIRKDSTNRFFSYLVHGNCLLPLSTNFLADGTAIPGQKLWIKSLDASNTVVWLYSAGNSTTTVHRMMLY